MIGEDEIIFRLIDHKRNTFFCYERNLSAINLSKEIFEDLFNLLLITRDYLVDNLNFNEQEINKNEIKSLENLKSYNLNEKIQNVKKLARTLKRKLNDEFKKSVLEFYLISKVIEIDSNKTSLNFKNKCNHQHNDERIELIFKKDKKIIIKKLKIDNDTTYFHKIFHLCSIMHSLKNLLIEMNYDKIKEIERIEKEYEICIVPDLYLFKNFSLPEEEKKKFSNILKKVLSRK